MATRSGAGASFERLLLLALALRDVSTVSAQVHRIELERKVHFQNDAQQAGDVRPPHLNRAIVSSISLAQQAPLIAEPLVRKGQVIYIGSVSLGQPPQQVSLIFDTGSSDLWVNARGGSYDPSASRTLRPYSPEEVTITYGVGSASGFYELEEVCLDAETRTTMCGQLPIMIAEKTEDMDQLGSLGASGLLGLGLLGISHTPYCFTRSLQQSFRDAAFGLSLVGSRTGSSVSFGELDTVLAAAEESTGVPRSQVARADVLQARFFGNSGPAMAGWWLVDTKISTEVPLATRQYGARLAVWQSVLAGILFLSTLSAAWMVGTSGILAGSRPRACAYVFTFTVFFSIVVLPRMHDTAMILQAAMTSSVRLHQPAILDSGSTNLVIPQDEAEAFARALLGIYSVTHCLWSGGVLLCDCSIAADVPDIEVEIGGVVISLHAEDFFLELDPADDDEGEPPFCYTGVQSSTNTPFILGEIFLRAVYLVHDISKECVYAFPWSKGSSPKIEEAAIKVVHAGRNRSTLHDKLMLVLSSVALLGCSFMAGFKRIRKVEPLEGHLDYERLEGAPSQNIG